MKSRRSVSVKISVDKAFRLLGLPRSASLDEITSTYKRKLEEVQKKHPEQVDRMVAEADELYAAYQAAYMSKEGANEDDLLPMTLSGPDTLLEAFGLQDMPARSMKVQMHTQTQFKDGQLVKKDSNRTESFVNRDGKREFKVWENGKLVKHTIDGKDVLGTKLSMPGTAIIV